MRQQFQCPRCGAQVAFGARFCGNCQTPLNWPTQPQPPAQYQQPPPQYQQQYQQQPQQPASGYQQQSGPPKKKTNVWLMGCLGMIVLAAVIGGIALAVSTSSPATKATTPSSIVSKVKVGMTIADVMEVVDIDKLTAEKCFVVVDCNSLSFNNDVLNYEATKDIESPYFMWLCFGSVVQNLNPAVIGFSANPEMVIGTGRIDFAEAQTLVEWNSNRPFRR